MNAKELSIIVESQRLQIESLQEQVNLLLESKRSTIKGRDYGNKSERKATRHDAWRIRFGDLVGHKARQISEELGLSRGQSYSILGDYTFRDVKEDEFPG